MQARSPAAARYLQLGHLGDVKSGAPSTVVRTQSSKMEKTGPDAEYAMTSSSSRPNYTYSLGMAELEGVLLSTSKKAHLTVGHTYFDWEHAKKLNSTYATPIGY